MNFFEKHLGGHFNIGPATFYGHNAMHFAVNIATRWGWICFQPPIWQDGHFWPWKFYISPDATPQKSTLAYGPGMSLGEKLTAPIRRKLFGWNFGTTLEFVRWNRELCDQLEHIYYLNHRVSASPLGTAEFHAVPEEFREAI